MSLYEHTDRNRMHTDETSRFPIKSIRGYQHTLIACVYDTNTIIYRPLKIKQAEEPQHTYEELHACLTTWGCKPKFHRFDNELSKETQ